MRIGRIINGLELLLELDEVRIDTFEDFQLTHSIELLIHLAPLEIIEPVGRIRLDFTLATGSGQEESPFLRIDLAVTEHDLCAQEEREE